MNNILNEFRNYLKLKDYKPRGIEEYLRSINKYINYSEENRINIYTLSIKDAEGYREYLRLMTKEDGSSLYNPKTINKEISFLRLFYTFLISKGRAFRNPFNDIEKMKESHNLPKNILTIEQTEKLLNGIQVEDKNDFEFKVLIELLYSTGARISEIEELTRDRINLKTGYIKIEDDKERQDRKAVLTEYSLELLRLYVRYFYSNGKRLFQHGKSRTLNRWINDRLKSLTKRLKLPKVTCHGIRHTIASQMFKKGADIREVSEFLGHRRLKNTEIYTHIFPDDLKDIVEKNHPREREFKKDK
jgi:integrase/recombinase XerD